MSVNTVNIVETIDTRPIGRFQVGVIALCAATIFLDGFDAQCIGYVAPTLIKEWGVSPPQFAPVFAAGLFGIMLGALIMGPVADYIGRRKVIIWCTALAGLLTLCTTLTQTVQEMAIVRVLTGVMLGGTIPNLIALTDEYVPKRRRGGLVMLMVCGISLGSAVGGVVSAQLIPVFGWEVVFWIGGVLPLLITVALIWKLPESIRFLGLKGDRQEQVRNLLRRIDPSVPASAQATFVVAGKSKAKGLTVQHLFQEGRAPMTFLLWVMFFMNLLNLYFMTSWLPTLISGVGHSIQRAVLATTLFQVFGIFGTLLVSRVVDRFHSCAVLGTLYLTGAFCVISIGLALGLEDWVVVAVACAGFCIVGGQSASNAVIASLYPTSIRSTGVGWGLGIGRIGSIVGSSVGGYFLAQHWAEESLFFVASVPAFCSSVAAFTLVALAKKRAQKGMSK